ncbi:MAG: DUF3034 family protein [Candidatus Omnitrophica bacterium]|jgi:hypothetical protein|nr:DUF3034 family protein [Candidatus Omnitrophota bacterium]
MKKLLIALLITGAIVNIPVLSYAGPPFNSLEGEGGVAFNPLAYVADSTEEGSHLTVKGVDIIGKPRFGAWYVNLPDSKIDWTAFGVADTLFKRIEISYGYETINWENHPTFHKNNIGAKVLLLDENSFGSQFVPAFSIGTIYKTTSANSLHQLGLPLRTTGVDWYAVATKTITQTPLPVILSGGILSSQEYVTGVLGFDTDREITGFANIDVVLPHGFVVGYEFKQGEQFDDGYKNANYWDAHLAWLANKNLTIIAAYTYTGNVKTETTRTGLGGGFVISAQYAF